MPSTAIVRVEPLDQCYQLLLGNVGGQLVLEAFHPRLARRLGLGADVDGARRMFADQHDREPGERPVRRLNSAARAATRSRRPAANALPSISRAVIRRNSNWRPRRRAAS